MGHLGEAARDCGARRKVAMVEGVRFFHKAAAYHVNAEKKEIFYVCEQGVITN